MKTVTKIEAKKSVQAEERKRRVAAYCRVSTSNTDQLESLETQKAHYESWIKLHLEWEYAGLYYDSGITGTRAYRREGLQNMLQACHMGKIDHILVKSISRFSRNTTDCLSIVRELLGIGVTIYFEKENIDTGSMESELILSILSSMAEDESASISKNEKWSIQRRFQNGTYKMPYMPYGYTKDENGNMAIEPNEAEIVRFIFASILSGKSTHIIAKALQAQHIPTRKGGKWSGTTVRDIVANEKYVGDALFQKTYTDENFKRHTNNGEEETFLVHDHHEPIVSREVFRKANDLISQRATEKGIVRGSDKYQKRYSFSGKIICGSCGAAFKRRIQNDGAEIAWACKTHIDDIHRCGMKYVRDDILKAAFVTMLNKLIFARKLILKPLLECLKAGSSDENVHRMQKLQGLLEENTEKCNTLRKLRATAVIDNVIFNQEWNLLKKQADEYRMELSRLSRYTSGDAESVLAAEHLLKFTETAGMQLTFSDDLFLKFVDSIIVYDRSHIGFKLKCGLTLKEVI